MSESRSRLLIWGDLVEPFPPDVIDEKNGLLYIPHEIIRDRLIEATENQFNWSIDQVLFRDDGVTRRPNDRNTGEPRRPISMIVIGTLTIPGLGSRAGIGAHPLDEGAGEDAAYKSAESDAIKRAAMGFGVGLRQLYIETGEAKRVQKPGRRPNPQQRNVKTPETVSMTDEQFAIQLKEAMRDRDASQFRQLVKEAEARIPRWITLVQSADSAQSLEWIARQAEKAGAFNEVIKATIERQKVSIGITETKTVNPDLPATPGQYDQLRSMARRLKKPLSDVPEDTLTRQTAVELLHKWTAEFEQTVKEVESTESAQIV